MLFVWAVFGAQNLSFQWRDCNTSKMLIQGRIFNQPRHVPLQQDHPPMSQAAVESSGFYFVRVSVGRFGELVTQVGT
ncbi:MAG: hypothetical protein U0V49_05640 [Saprospiraceae bacterium]